MSVIREKKLAIYKYHLDIRVTFYIDWQIFLLGSLLKTLYVNCKNKHLVGFWFGYLNLLLRNKCFQSLTKCQIAWHSDYSYKDFIKKDVDAQQFFFKNHPSYQTMNKKLISVWSNYFTLLPTVGFYSWNSHVGGNTLKAKQIEK